AQPGDHRRLVRPLRRAGPLADVRGRAGHLGGGRAAGRHRPAHGEESRMTPSWELLCALALSFAGLLALAAAMDRHQRDLAGRTFAARSGRLLRVAGWLLLA